MNRASKLDGKLFNYFKSNVTELRERAAAIRAKVGDKIESSFYESSSIDESAILQIRSIDQEVKRYLKNHPEKLYVISPRKFEELIADIFQDLGFDVELTNATRDGGRDIIASIRNSVTSFITYVECKKYAPDIKVGVNLIRQVQGVQYTRMPNKSIIVTTSYFTKDARKEARLIENALDLKDFDDIRGWLSRY